MEQISVDARKASYVFTMPDARILCQLIRVHLAGKYQVNINVVDVGLDIAPGRPAKLNIYVDGVVDERVRSMLHGQGFNYEFLQSAAQPEDLRGGADE